MGKTRSRTKRVETAWQMYPWVEEKGQESYPRGQEISADWGFQNLLEAHTGLAADAKMWIRKGCENLTRGEDLS
jgi:hypothetical protein